VTTTKTVRSGYDAWVDTAHPAKPHGRNPFLRMKTGAEYAFVYLRNPAPRGTTIVSATLQLHAHGASTGSRTLTARRAAGHWDDDTVTFNRMPGVTGTSQPTAALGTVADGDLIEFDVTAHLQKVTSGKSRWYGWRIQTDATAEHSVYGFNAGKYMPRLIVQFTYKPDFANNLRPSGGAVSLAKPTLSYDFHDISGKIDLVSHRVQLDPTGNWTSPGFDSGELGAVDGPVLDLNDTSYSGLADGASTQWRVIVKGSDGVWSDWSDPATFSRHAQGPLAITSPATSPGDLVTEPTPTIVWSFANQAAYQVIVTSATNHAKVLFDSGKQRGTDQTFTLPKGILTTPSGRYSLLVRCWDTTVRVTTTGDPIYRQLRRDFTFTYDATPNPVTALSVARPDAAPRLRLTWTRSSTPDSYVIERDGVVIDADLTDLLISGTTYSFDDWTATAGVNHDYRVRPVVNGKACSNSPVVTAKWTAYSVYLADPDTGAWFMVLGAPGDTSGPSINLAYGEDADVTTRAGQYPVRKITAMRGLEGDVSGMLIQNDWDPRTLDDQVADVLTIKGRTAVVTCRLVVGGLNIPVIIGNVNPAPSTEYLEEIPCRAVSFWVGQNGEMPFKIEV